MIEDNIFYKNFKKNPKSLITLTKIFMGASMLLHLLFIVALVVINKYLIDYTVYNIPILASFIIIYIISGASTFVCITEFGYRYSSKIRLVFTNFFMTTALVALISCVTYMSRAVYVYQQSKTIIGSQSSFESLVNIATIITIAGFIVTIIHAIYLKCLNVIGKVIFFGTLNQSANGIHLSKDDMLTTEQVKNNGGDLFESILTKLIDQHKLYLIDMETVVRDSFVSDKPSSLSHGYVQFRLFKYGKIHRVFVPVYSYSDEQNIVNTSLSDELQKSEDDVNVIIIEGVPVYQHFKTKGKSFVAGVPRSGKKG